MSPIQEAYGFKSYLETLSRHRRMVLVIFSVTSLAVVAASLLTPPVYRARTAILVKFGWEFASQPEVGNARNPPVLRLQEMVNSEVEILESRDLAEQVVAELGVWFLYPGLLDDDAPEDLLRAKSTARFQRSVSVIAVPESSIIKASFEHSEPEMAANALNVLVERFKDKHLEVFSDSKSTFLEGQLREYRERHARSHAALEALKERHGIYQVPEQKDFLLAQRFRLDVDLKAAEITLLGLQRRLTSLDGGMEGPAAEAVAPVPDEKKLLAEQRSELQAAMRQAKTLAAEIQRKLTLATAGDLTAVEVGEQERLRSLEEARIKLLDLRIREDDLVRKYDATSRLVAGTRQEIEVVERFLKERLAQLHEAKSASLRQELEALNARRQAIEAQIETVDAEMAALNRREISAEIALQEARMSTLRLQLAQLDRDIEQLSACESEMRELEREVTTSEQNLQAYAVKFEDARITEELNRQRLVSIRVIEKASPPVSAEGLSRSMRVALGAVVGLLAAGAAALLLDRARR
jgi:uncharacterized protein involved in exopolysaccharide biosynthesis